MCLRTQSYKGRFRNRETRKHLEKAHSSDNSTSAETEETPWYLLIDVSESEFDEPFMGLA